MSIFQKTVRGVVAARPLRVLLYGQPGIGKSTFAADAPAPYFLDAETGTFGLDVDRAPIESWLEVKQAVRDFIREDHSFRTLVLDTLSAYERLLVSYVCDRAGEDDIASGKLGFGKGWAQVAQEWTELLGLLEQLQAKRRMNIFALAHAEAATHREPTGEDYQQWTPLLSKKASHAWQGWAEEVLFATRLVQVKARERRASGGRRVLITEWRPGVDAKNRRNLPAEMPLEWGPFADALRRGVASVRPQEPVSPPEHNEEQSGSVEPSPAPPTPPDPQQEPEAVSSPAPVDVGAGGPPVPSSGGPTQSARPTPGARVEV